MKTQEEIKQLAESEYGTDIESIRGSNPYDLEKDRKNGFIKGYTQCQEDTEQEINRLKKIMIESSNQAMTWEEKYWQLKNSLNKQD
jgi:hypothetical protein